MRRFQTSDIFQQRRELLESTVPMIREHPITGSGLGTWAIVYPRFAVFEPGLAVYHAHDEWIEWAAEGGVPFVALLGAVVLRSLLSDPPVPLGRGRRRRGNACICGLSVSRLCRSAVLLPYCSPPRKRLQRIGTSVADCSDHPDCHTALACRGIDTATSCRARSKRIVLRMMLSKSVVGLQPVCASIRQMQGTRLRMSSKPPSG